MHWEEAGPVDSSIESEKAPHNPPRNYQEVKLDRAEVVAIVVAPDETLSSLTSSVAWEKMLAQAVHPHKHKAETLARPDWSWEQA